MERGYFASIYLPELTLVVDQLCICTAHINIDVLVVVRALSLFLCDATRSPTNLSARPTHDQATFHGTMTRLNGQ